MTQDPDSTRPRAARTLLLVRHAKTEQAAGAPDHARQLLPRGVADARAGGAWLVAHARVPDLVLCSTATRAEQTWEQLAAGAEAARVEVWPDRRIYNADPEQILAVIQEVPVETRTLLVVGHAPGIPSLGMGLADRHTSTPETLATLSEGMPTAVALELEVDTPWADLSAESARLVAVHRWRGKEET